MNATASLTILFPSVVLPLFGIFLLTRKQHFCVVLGGLFVLVSTVFIGIFLPFIPWAYDSLVDWKMELSAEIPEFRVVLVQTPSSDFYNSTFRISRADGRRALVSYDNDDTRWWSGRLHREGDKIYFLRGQGQIDEQTSYIDIEEATLYSGYHKTIHALSELNYR